MSAPTDTRPEGLSASDSSSTAVLMADSNSAPGETKPTGQIATTPDTPDTTDEPLPPAVPVQSGNTLSLTILLISGARHILRIDSSFLSRHSLKAETPFDISVASLKECIWRDWQDISTGQEGWEARPPSAHFIRLIHFGRLWEDNKRLGDFKLTRGDTNVVHMTLRPSDSGEDDMTQRSANPKSERRGASCRCVIL